MSHLPRRVKSWAGNMLAPDKAPIGPSERRIRTAGRKAAAKAIREMNKRGIRVTVRKADGRVFHAAIPVGAR